MYVVCENNHVIHEDNLKRKRINLTNLYGAVGSPVYQTHVFCPFCDSYNFTNFDHQDAEAAWYGYEEYMENTPLPHMDFGDWYLDANGEELPEDYLYYITEVW